MQVQKLNNDLMNEYMSPILNEYLEMIEILLNKNARYSNLSINEL